MIDDLQFRIAKKYIIENKNLDERDRTVNITPKSSVCLPVELFTRFSHKTLQQSQMKKINIRGYLKRHGSKVHERYLLSDSEIE